MKNSSGSSIALVVPTRNCRQALNNHLQNLANFREGISEIVFVDSESTDGTLELIQGQLADWPKASLLQTPPGLYASWNAAIAEISSTWVNIATVGDLLRPGGLAQLLDCAEKYDADVVLSPPAMVNAMQERVPTRWPIHELLEMSGPPQMERLLKECEKWLFLTTLLPSSILGSAASNLYRSCFLQKHPFPTSFGHEGDVAWGVKVAPFVRIAVLGKECASFLVHERETVLTASMQGYRFSQLCELTAAVFVANRIPAVTEAATISACQQMQVRSLWSWLIALESVQDERLSYISTLEKERERLKRELHMLDSLQIFPFAKRPSLGDFATLARPLKRCWDATLQYIANRRF